jgi:molecular chaperone HscA
MDASGGVLLPSVVSYQAGAPPLVGHAAERRAAVAPHDTIASVKRLMGRGTQDAQKAGAAERFAPHRLASSRSDGSDVVRLVVAGDRGPREVTPIEVSAEILRALRQRAEILLGTGDDEAVLDGAVITVPAYFDDAQRQATRDAGKLAGLNVLRLLNEPTAAALAYGLDKKRVGKFAVYDLGGGTFDVSILDLSEGIFTVLSTAGDTALGGDDMDRALVDLLLHKHPDPAGTSDRLHNQPGEARALRAQARAIKHALTEQAEVTTTVLGQTMTLTRAEFEQAIAGLLERTSVPCRRALKDAELTPSELDGVVLVGGATRVPAVRRHVASLFQREPLADLNPDEVVALGAAVQADILGSERTDALLIDVTPLSLGLELMGGVMEKIIPRNSRVPTGARQVFTTYADGQTGFDLHVLQGERETAAGCRSLARFTLGGLPKMGAGMARLEVSFLIDENGLLSVSARELSTGKEAHITVKPSYGLTDEEVEAMLLASFEHGETDLRQRMLITQHVEADRIVAALDAALAADGELLSSDERAALDVARQGVLTARAGTEHRRIAEAITALDAASQGFAQRRMDKSLNQAMSGRAISEVEHVVEQHAAQSAAHKH